MNNGNGIVLSFGISERPESGPVAPRVLLEYGMSHPELVRFVRDTMGCKCPDDVLSQIECSGGHVLPCGVALIYRLDVGGRLLVYVADENDMGHLVELLKDGVSERERLGFNRFRLALVADNIEDCGRRALGMLSPASGLLELAGVAGLDERVHLHVIRRGRLF